MFNNSKKLIPIHFSINALIFLSVLFFISCQKAPPNLEKIYLSLDEDSILSNKSSFLYSRVGFSLKEVEASINKKMGKIIFEDKEYVNRNNIYLKIKIERTENIKISGKNNHLYFRVPIKLKGRVLINEKIMGVKVKAEPTFTLSLTLYLESDISFRNELDYNIITKVRDIEWSSDPIIRTGPIKIDLSTALESMIYNNTQALSEIIEKSAKQELDIKKEITSKLGKLNQSYLVNRKDINLSIGLHPKSIIVSRRPIIKEDSFSLNIGLELEVDMFSGIPDSTTLNLEDLEFLAVNKMEENLDLNIKFSLTYTEVQNLVMTKIKKGKGLNLPGNIELSNFQIGKYSEGEIWLSAQSQNHFEGQIYSYGNLTYDSLAKELRLSDSEIYFYSDNTIAQILFDLFSSSFKNEIEGKVKWPINPLFLKVNKAVELLLQKVSNKYGLNIDLDNLNFDIQSINPKKDEIEFMISISGNTNFQYTIQ